MASGREIISRCLPIHLSRAVSSAGNMRKWMETAPVGGRPRPRFFLVRDVDTLMIFAYQKIASEARR
jgi:hypothetical protein